jgi:two-component system, chemotaxis family, chemotaxis protein CheY
VATILFCEDDDLYRQVAQAAFAQSGHRVQFAHNGDQALALLQSDPADLVITDLVMPGRDGLELICAIRGTRHHLPILAITAGVISLKEALLVAASAFGADDVLQKPFRPAVLRERAEALLEKAAKRQAGNAA